MFGKSEFFVCLWLVVKFLNKSYKDVKENREIIFSFRTY